MTDLRDNSRGILAMNAAMLAFNLSDATTKLMTQELPLGETVFLRGLIATVVVAVVAIFDGSWREARRLVDGRIAIRLVGEIGGTVTYLIALVHLPLPSVTSVFQATPLAMTAAAAVFLGEKVGPRRWIAIAVGFLGVMIIVRPGLAGFSPHSVLVLISVAFVVMRDISTARLGSTLPTAMVTLATAASVTLLGLVLMPFERYVSLQTEWVMPNLRQVGILTLCAMALLGGYSLLIEATRRAETSAIAPYRYVLLVWAFLFGIVLFGDLPDVPTLIGAAIVVATGLYTFHRERTVRRQRGG